MDSIQTDLLREEGKNTLIEILDSYRGTKCLILDMQLGGLLNHILPEGSKILKESNVQLVKELKADYKDITDGKDSSDIDHIIYLVRPAFDQMKKIAKQVLGCKSRPGIYSSSCVKIVISLHI